MIGRNRRYLIWGLIGFIGVAMILYVAGRGGPSLDPWHTEKLTAEFTAKKGDVIRTFDDYKQLEDKLFAQLEKQVYPRVGTGPAYALVRYSAGSAADPQRRSPNWNRSFELPTDSPVGAPCCCTACRTLPTACGPSVRRSTITTIGSLVCACPVTEPRHRGC